MGGPSFFRLKHFFKGLSTQRCSNQRLLGIICTPICYFDAAM
ncbi:hypothetical protein RGAI101_3897 [Roseobacter sp. GAI101]|nr:hypothetical protein RGAI101_3897 [Roseobacter sp. GAI101]